MINKFMKNGSMKVRVVSDKGKSYTAEVTVDPAIYGEKAPVEEKKVEAEKNGKQYVYNVKLHQWQSLKITEVYIKTEDGLVDEWFPFEIYERKHPVRMSLEEAINILETVLGAKVEIVKKRQSADDPRYRMVDKDNNITDFKTGYEVVRLAKGMA